MLRTIAIAAVLTAALASKGSAQDLARPDSTRADSARSTTLATVVVVAKPPQPNMFSRAWHMQEDRAQVIAMMNENRRLAAELRRYDAQVVTLEKKLVTVKAEHDRKTAAIAATDSLTADAHRRRVELEEKLRRLEGTVALRPAAAAVVAFPGQR